MNRITRQFCLCNSVESCPFVFILGSVKDITERLIRIGLYRMTIPIITKVEVI